MRAYHGDPEHFGLGVGPRPILTSSWPHPLLTTPTTTPCLTLSLQGEREGGREGGREEGREEGREGEREEGRERGRKGGREGGRGGSIHSLHLFLKLLKLKFLTHYTFQ